MIFKHMLISSGIFTLVQAESISIVEGKIWLAHKVQLYLKSFNKMKC